MSPVPIVWDPFDRLDAGDLNADMDYLDKRASATVRRVATQSCGNAASVLVSWDTEVVDTDAMFDIVAPTLLVCKTAGRYRITALLQWAGSATGSRQLAVLVNAVVIDNVISYPVNSNQWSPPQLTITLELAVNDQVTVRVIQAAGASLNLNFARCDIDLISPT